MIVRQRKRAFSLAGTLAGLLTLLFLGFPTPNASAVTVAANATGEEIQAALDNLPPEGGEVVLAAGTYQIHRPIILQRDHQTLRGSGPDTILFLADKANCPVIVLGAPDRPLNVPTTQIHVTDLIIDGNRAHQQVEFWRTAADGSLLNNNGIDVWSVTDATVEQVVCRSCRSGGLVTAQVKRLEVCGYTAYDNEYDGLACYQTTESKFTGLDLHDNLAAGISLDLDFNHNIIERASLIGNELGVFMRNSRDNVFQALDISQSRKHGVFIAQTAAPATQGWELVPGTECTGNEFVKPVITNCGGQAFLINDASCTNNVVSKQVFVNNAGDNLGSLPAANMP